jgi:hypothetical protein
MLLQISVKDDKAELFLQLVEELKSSMIDRFDIVSKDGTILSDDFFDERELLKRANELKQNKIKPLSREEVFDGIC